MLSRTSLKYKLQKIFIHWLCFSCSFRLITIPGVDTTLLTESMKNATTDNLFGLYDMFVGGAFSNAAIFALGIMPYISASIIIQLLGAVVPYFQKLQQEGEEGRKKITQLTRYGTVLISGMQAWGVTIRLLNIQVQGLPIVPETVSGFAWVLSTIIILTSGTIFMMWMGEQITERGIGNGISLIIFIFFSAALADTTEID
jgi:preprotein translocase subunit SecY